MFIYTAAGSTNFYTVPQGTEDTLFGNGVLLKVTIQWDGTVTSLYLNDILADSTPYTVPTPNWTSASIFDLGAYELLNYGGFDTLDDIIDEFTCFPPPWQLTGDRSSLADCEPAFHAADIDFRQIPRYSYYLLDPHRNRTGSRSISNLVSQCCHWSVADGLLPACKDAGISWTATVLLLQGGTSEGFPGGLCCAAGNNTAGIDGDFQRRGYFPLQRDQLFSLEGLQLNQERTGLTTRRGRWRYLQRLPPEWARSQYNQAEPHESHLLVL